MNLKVGDKLLCKKEYTYHSGFEIIPGNYYEVSFVSFFWCRVSVIGYSDEYVNFDLQETNILSSLNIWNYFYTDKEIRKLKLDELEGRR